MLNRAARFFPIISNLRRTIAADATVLEVGSGSLGLGEFWSGPFVGCDLTFASRPVRGMRAVRCSGHQLPFKDGGFDVVVVSDVIEHVPPPLRGQVVQEVLRVASKVAIFGYPCGPAASALDEQLYRRYQSRGLQPPVWLEEHTMYPFPEEDLFRELPNSWKKTVIPNESLEFHEWMMRAEMFRPWDYTFRLALLLIPRFVERWLQRANREPSYRKIFFLTHEP